MSFVRNESDRPLRGLRGLRESLLPLPSLALFWAQAAVYRNHAPYDDAFITFRYSRNLADGFGPVFNPGEYVEGYTNFLWMVILAGTSWLGIDVPTAATWLGVLCGSATIWIVYRWGRADPSGSIAQTGLSVGSLAALLLALMHPFAFHSVMGLETALFTLLATAALASYQGSKTLSGGTVWLLLACALTRPEGLLFGGVLFVHSALLQWRNDELRWGSQKSALLAGAVFGAYLCWKFLYYGELLPNTYYAKQAAIGDDVRQGLAYLWAHIRYNGGFLTIASVLFLMWRRHDTRLLGFGVPLLLVVSVQVVRAGGDHFPHWRMLVPLLPLSAILIARAVDELAAGWGGRVKGESDRSRAGGRWRRPSVQLAAVLSCGWISLLPGLSESTGLKQTYEQFDRKWAFIGQRLAEILPPGTTIAISPIGAFSFYSKLPVIDILGLTDAHIGRTRADPFLSLKGHQKHDGDYVLSRRPDFLILNNGDIVTLGDGGAPQWLPDFRVSGDGEQHPGPSQSLPARPLGLPYERDIVENAELRRHYRLVALPLAGPYHLLSWQLRERHAALPGVIILSP